MAGGGARRAHARFALTIGGDWPHNERVSLYEIRPLLRSEQTAARARRRCRLLGYLTTAALLAIVAASVAWGR